MHKTPNVTTAFEGVNCDILFIPGGLTPVLQPLDISVNKPVKDYIRDAYSRWARNTFNPESGLARPQRKDIAEWLAFAWNSISTETIKNGFIEAGLFLL